MVARRIDVAERRARAGVRHRLAAPAETPLEVARALVALHGSDPATVYLAAAARLGVPDVVAIDRALYDDRLMLRMLCMRRTVFAVPAELVPVAQAACANDVARLERRRTLRLLEEAGIGDAAWLSEVEDGTLAALRTRGEAYATDLSADEPRLQERITLSPGKKYASKPAIAGRVLLGLSADGRIVRGRPGGSWTSSRFRWSSVESWLPGGIPSLPAGTASAELVRRWLAAYGPGTLADLAWWTGLSRTRIKAALAHVETEEVDLDGTPGLVLAGDADPTPEPAPWVALLPALDPTLMGWTGRDWYLGPYAPRLFDRSGNPGPTVWADGRVIGGWAQRADGEIVHRLFEDVGAETAEAVTKRAADLSAWIGPVRVTPRFRTPLERELTA
jgi:hypothetical protein